MSEFITALALCNFALAFYAIVSIIHNPNKIVPTNPAGRERLASFVFTVSIGVAATAAVNAFLHHEANQKYFVMWVPILILSAGLQIAAMFLGGFFTDE